MNDQLQKSFAEMIQKSVTLMENGGAFLSDELPSFVNQLLMWIVVKDVITIIVGFAAIIFSVKLFLISKKYSEDNSSRLLDDYSVYAATIIAPPFSALIILVSVWSIFGDALELFQVLIAPKVFLIQHLKDLIK